MLLRWFIAWMLTVAPVLAAGASLLPAGSSPAGATHESCCCVEPEPRAVEACCVLTAAGEDTGESRCDSEGCSDCQQCLQCCPTTGKPLVFLSRVSFAPAVARADRPAWVGAQNAGIGASEPGTPPPKR
jgi:hypothetical protein